MANEITSFDGLSYADSAVNVAASFDVPLRQGDRLDQRLFHERYKRMPADFRAELLGGTVYVASPLAVRHGRAHGLIMAWLGAYEAATTGVMALDGATVILGSDSEPQPDAMLIVDPRRGGSTHLVDGRGSDSGEQYVGGAPELAVEVASSSQAYDLHAKRHDYQRHGVGEYGVVMLRDRAVRWFYREGDEFVDAAQDDAGAFRSRVFPGLWLDVRALLAGDLRAVLATLDAGIKTPEHAAFCETLATADRT